MTGQCAVEHCPNMARSRGRCNTCYNYLLAHGRDRVIVVDVEDVTEDDDVVDIFPQWPALAAEHLRQYPQDDELVEIVGRQYRFTLDERVLRAQRWYAA